MADLWFDTFSAMDRGSRDEQQDALGSDFFNDGSAGIIALADGCGGHLGGSVASRIAVETAMASLLKARDESGGLSGHVPTCLTEAVQDAQRAVASQASLSAETEEMSTTLLLLAVECGKLYWASVGDSPLFLLREGELRQLNQDHSFAAYLELLVAVGEISMEEASRHPARHLLTSALSRNPYEKLDCPDVPFSLKEGDIILATSDGIQTLDPTEIASVAADPQIHEAKHMADSLIAAVRTAGSEEQDNVTVAAVSVMCGEKAVFSTQRTKFERQWEEGLRVGAHSP